MKDHICFLEILNFSGFDKYVLNKRVGFLIVLMTLFFSAGFSQPQTKKELEKKKAQLQKEISITNKLLEEAKKNKQISLNQLITLNQKINMREELINTIGSEVTIIDFQIEKANTNITELKKELDSLKAQYAKMIYYAYKNKNAYDRLMFIFAAKDFNQAFQRLKYLQEYSDYRKKQAFAMLAKQKVLNEKIQDLIIDKTNRSQLLTVKEKEKLNLTKEKTEQEEVLGQLQDKEKKLKADLKKKQEDASKLQLAIQKIIEAEIKKSKELALKKEKANTPKEVNPKIEKGKKEVETEITLTPEAEKLSSDFESNKSKLPWPVAEGVIVSTFGEHEHPTLKGVKVKNNGIDISTNSAAQVRAIFEGEVIGVVGIPGAGKAIIISHGKYLTVYSNLQETFVKKGDKVKTKQSIGSARTDDDAKTEVHFELWKGYSMLNPMAWIYNK